MECLGDFPIERLAAGRALLRKHVPGLIEDTAGNGPEIAEEDLDDPGAEHGNALAAFIEELEGADG
jgi:hypothetical protein